MTAQALSHRLVRPAISHTDWHQWSGESQGGVLAMFSGCEAGKDCEGVPFTFSAQRVSAARSPLFLLPRPAGNPAGGWVPRESVFGLALRRRLTTAFVVSSNPCSGAPRVNVPESSGFQSVFPFIEGNVSPLPLVGKLHGGSASAGTAKAARKAGRLKGARQDHSTPFLPGFDV